MKILSQTGSIIFLIIFFFAALLLPSPLRGESSLNPDPYRHKKQVWEPAAEIAPGVVIPGFWRPGDRRGYVWVEACRDEANRWHPGYWKPRNEYRLEAGLMKWVPGYWSGKEWVPGYWRPPVKKGFIWVEGRYNLSGQWQEARWERAPVF